MTEQTFEVGDKVRVLAGGEGVVTYGPVNSTFDAYKMYVVKQEGDNERAFKAVDLEALPKFAVGDKVTMGLGDEYTTSAGPFNGISAEFWVLKRADGTHLWSRADALTRVEPAALVPVGTRVRVDRATYAEEYHGHEGVVIYNDLTWREMQNDIHPYVVKFDDGNEVHAAEVTPVEEPAGDFEYKGVTYEYGAPYRDRDGDLFRFRSTLSDDGSETPQGQIVYGVGDTEGGDWHWSLAEVLRDYAPLTKQ
ncbi:phiSA1p31-related protein [Streptomyces halstedii]|uniref:phiSA1p31-related protein n=1 Tax=Streptomyces halstedii TaxID=1944 RepID=UPI00381EF071